MSREVTANLFWFYEMAILSKARKPYNFESQNFLKLSFTKIQGLRSNYLDVNLSLNRILLLLQLDSNPQPLSSQKNTRTFRQPFMLVWLNGWVFVYKLCGWGFESSCSHLNFRFRACFKQGVLWHSGNFRVWIQSETRKWHDKNIQSPGIVNLCETNSDDSIDSRDFSTQGYLPLVQKDSAIRKHVLAVCVKEGFPFARDSPENSLYSYLGFRLYFSFSISLLFLLLITFFWLAHDFISYFISFNPFMTEADII